MGVPQLVQAGLDPGARRRAGEGHAERRRACGPVREQEIRPAEAEAEMLLGLGDAVPAQRVDCDRRQRDRPPALLVFGHGLIRVPAFVSSITCSTCSRPASRSTCAQLRPSSSPRRRPVASASSTGTASAVPATASSKRACSAASRVRIAARSTCGGSVASTGLTTRSFSLTARASAACSVRPSAPPSAVTGRPCRRADRRRAPS